ncbi:hypothetical protein PFICI_14643 [Pestalotiopsis fici W106-1]|uniref:Uncharacterized protein n=1 Tax=Pestalotiopsis fici (strain W106-1 / CGMCC3.15140) TaxID=1229662 RepID=W3WKK9_PESFW|nr:uncharacterized protein PFICI_14643 [Pestalotiopsis fici W106-1]ETS73697.1 hypothetical protein PFICI_14643 [Pestalotiopsis fici W106-1]
MPSAMSSRPVSIAEAKKMVEDISEDHGYLAEDELQALDEKTRKRIIEVMLKKDRMSGKSVITLAKNLYSSTTRFVFELLQNTDDNSYSMATGNGIEPYASFQIFPDKIVLECNEDGFTREDLIAICEVGQSSKVGAQGYIGEKGIGFKSVFMAAHKVHIQSGNFSFSFVHRRGDSGMGMISPIWEDPDTNLSSRVTRITLFLHDTGSALEIQERHQQIVQQFQDIQDTHLLFLRKIRRIKIIFSHHGNPTTTTFEVANLSHGHRITLRKSVADNPAEETYYHVTKNTADGIPESENRVQSELTTTPATSSAEIILAFPLDRNSIPIIQTQNVFAFLPIRNMGFKFLIHSDFVTQANRQDIVTTSARNLGLVSYIADTFANAMEELCHDTSLEFEWIKYLPQENDFPWDKYWKSVVADMKKKVSVKRLMRPQSGGPLKRIDQLCNLTDDALDELGEPLLEDIDPEVYLSSGYDLSTISSYLRGWGLRNFHMTQFLDRVEADLARDTSRFKSPQSSPSWHTRTAQVLNRPFKSFAEKHRKRIFDFRLIPVQGGKWIPAGQTGSPLVFPTANGENIPSSLDLNIIDGNATLNAERRKLFLNLGAKKLSVQAVRQLILDQYPSVINRSRLFGTNTTEQVGISLPHLSFLYLTQGGAVDKPSELRFIRVLTQEGLLIAPQAQDVYIKDNHKFGLAKLLENLPKFSVAFLDPYYLENAPQPASGREASVPWTFWLRTSLGVLDKPKLIANGSLTDMFRHIIEHNSGKLLGILGHYWNDIKNEVQQCQEIRDELSRVVLTMKGCTAQLKNSFLPMPELKARAIEYLGEAGTDEFPFLDLSDTLEPDDLSKWTFLNGTFGVRTRDDVEFYLAILSVLATRYPKPDMEISKKVYMLYETIYRKSRDSPDSDIRKAQKQVIRAYFDVDPADGNSYKGLLLVPGRTFQGGRWLQPNECRWDAPLTAWTLEPLAHLFGEVLTETEIDSAALKKFLQNILGIKDFTLTDILDELLYHAEMSQEHKDILYEDDGCYTTRAATDVYNHLEKLISSSDTSCKQDLLGIFGNEAFIFAADSWHKIEDCLWSSATDIEGKVILNDIYPDLAGLFVKELGVTTLTLQMAYDKLKKLGASDKPPISEVKSTWAAFHSLLSQTDKKPDPTPLLKRRLFPVKHASGHVELCCGTSPFAIIDRRPHGLLFAGKASLLDHSFEEVYQLRSTLKWAGLDTRYTSVAAKEVSAIIGGSETTLSDPHRDIGPRAHVVETDGIATELHLQQGTSTVIVKTSQSHLHIDASEDVLRVYIPRDRKQQQLCYSQTLPQRLYDWFMEQDGRSLPTMESTTCVSIIMQTLNVSCDNTEAILEGSGIAELSFPDDYEPVQKAAAQATEPSSQPSHRPPTPSGGRNAPLVFDNLEGSGSGSDVSVQSSPKSTPSSLAVPCLQPSGTQHVADVSGQISPSPSNGTFMSLLPRFSGVFRSSGVGTSSSTLVHTGQLVSVQGPSSSEEREMSNYIALLSKVIEIAGRSYFPNARSSSTISPPPDANGVYPRRDANTKIEFLSSSKLERDRMIGAAGELYVFELLSKMKSVLPGFGRLNWLSTIRKYVRQHPSYSDLIPWNGRETADIVYWDVSGTLTSELITLGYLDKKIWTSRRPSYYIEVKTTTGPHETPFYMSKSQFSRMQSKSNMDAEIYVIFRVSNLGSEQMGLVIYVDPEYMRQTAKLNFTVETYSVSPGFGGSSGASQGWSQASNSGTVPSFKFNSAPGTLNTLFSPTIQKESGSLGVVSYQHIGFQIPYQKFSVEELRLQSYQEASTTRGNIVSARATTPSGRH